MGLSDVLKRQSCRKEEGNGRIRIGNGRDRAGSGGTGAAGRRQRNRTVRRQPGGEGSCGTGGAAADGAPGSRRSRGEAPADFWNKLSRETGVPVGQLLHGVWKGAEERSGAGSQEARRDPAHASDGKQSEQKRDADIRGLLREFPDIQAKEIHQEVWDEVRRGGTLLEAYRNWTARHLREENQRLKASMSAGPANLRNRSPQRGAAAHQRKRHRQGCVSGSAAGRRRTVETAC